MPRRPPRRVLSTLDTLTSTPPPALTPSQTIARIVAAQGKNLFHIQLPSTFTAPFPLDSTDNVLVELASVFRGKAWMRRGGYVLVDLASFEGRENKICGEIVNVVRDERGWRGMQYWPAEFTKDVVEEDSDDEESNMGKMPPNSDSE